MRRMAQAYPPYRADKFGIAQTLTLSPTLSVFPL